MEGIPSAHQLLQCQRPSPTGMQASAGNARQKKKKSVCVCVWSFDICRACDEPPIKETVGMCILCDLEISQHTPKCHYIALVLYFVRLGMFYHFLHFFVLPLRNNTVKIQYVCSRYVHSQRILSPYICYGPICNFIKLAVWFPDWSTQFPAMATGWAVSNANLEASCLLSKSVDPVSSYGSRMGYFKCQPAGLSSSDLSVSTGTHPGLFFLFVQGMCILLYMEISMGGSLVVCLESVHKD